MASVKKIFLLESALFLLCTIVYIIGMVLIDVMDVDSSQYASISLEMFQSGSYLEVMHRGADYLDKPPLLFWLSAFFFKLFGVSHFTFRLPSFLFTLLGAYSTYKLGELLYNRRTGLISALIIFSSLAYFLFNHDVRADNLLTNSVIFAVWQLWKYIREERVINFLLGFLGIGLAMLAKGPIGLLIPAFAIGTDLLLKKDFKRIFHYKWLLGLILVLVVLSPMLYGLYTQYGLEGIRFFFWTQSFGRVTGESVWENDSTVFFFTHILLWAFLPWAITFLFAFFNKVKELVKDRFVVADEALTLGGFLITFVALSFSRYKLPHYIFVTFPFAAIITAKYLLDKLETREKRKRLFVSLVQPLQWFVNVVLVLAPLLFFLWIFPNCQLWVKGIYFLLFILWLAVWFYFKVENKLVYVTSLSMIVVAFVLNAHIYPSLLKYQSSSVAGKYLHQQNIDKHRVFWYKVEGVHALDFYFQHQPEYISDTLKLKEHVNRLHDVWLFTSDEHIEEISKASVRVVTLKKIPHQSVTLLTPRFLNPATRKEAIRYFYLVRVTEGSVGLF